MEDQTRLKLIILGLVLAAIAGAYLFFSGRFASQKNQVSQNIEASPSPIALETIPPEGSVVLPPGNVPPPNFPGNPPVQSDVQPLPQTGMSGDIATLPNTGLPMELVGSLGAAAVAVGYALRRFPK